MTTIALARSAGRARVSVSGNPLAGRVLRADAESARVALVATQALLLAGDHVAIEISIGAGLRLQLVDVAATVAYDGAGAASSWTVRAQVGAGASLVWWAQPFIVARGANVLRSNDFRLEAGAVACLRETLVLGRTGELGGALHSRTRVQHDDIPLLIEDLDLRNHQERSRPGVLGSARVIDSVLLLGRRAPADPVLPHAQRFELHGPGTIGRVLRDRTADSPVDAWAHAWASVQPTGMSCEPST